MDIEAIKEELRKEAQKVCKEELNNLVVRLGKEESKVEKLTARLIELGFDVDKLLEDSASRSLGGAASSSGKSQLSQENQSCIQQSVQLLKDLKPDEAQKESKEELGVDKVLEGSVIQSKPLILTPSTSLNSDTYLSRLLSPPPATTPFSSYLSQHLPDGVSKLNLEADQKVKLDQSREQQRKQDEAELYKQMRLSEAIEELRGEEAPGKVRKPKANTKKVKKETVPIEPREPIEPLSWLDLSLCTAPVSFFSSQKKRPRKTVSASEPPLESEATVASPPLKSEGSVAEVEASSKVTVASPPLKSEETVASPPLKSEATVASPPLESDATVASTSITEKTLSKRVEAIQEELVTEKTLSQEIAKYMRLFHEFRILRLEQIDMEDPEDKEEQKEEVESSQRDVVRSAREVMTDAKKGRRPLVKFLDVVKEEIKNVEKKISCVKDEIETAKKKLDEDAREKEK